MELVRNCETIVKAYVIIVRISSRLISSSTVHSSRLIVRVPCKGQVCKNNPAFRRRSISRWTSLRWWIAALCTHWRGFERHCRISRRFSSCTAFGPSCIPVRFWEQSTGTRIWWMGREWAIPWRAGYSSADLKSRRIKILWHWLGIIVERLEKGSNVEFDIHNFPISYLWYFFLRVDVLTYAIIFYDYNSD